MSKKIIATIKKYWEVWLSIPIKWHIAYMLFAIALGFFLSFLLTYLGWF